jgi:hypothetical protein
MAFKIMDLTSIEGVQDSTYLKLQENTYVLKFMIHACMHGLGIP